MDAKLRLFRWDDLDAMVTLYNAESAALHDVWMVSNEQMRAELQEPGMNPETDVFVIESPADDGTLIGTALVEYEPEIGRSFFDLAAMPDDMPLVAPFLLDAAETRARELWRAQPPPHEDGETDAPKLEIRNAVLDTAKVHIGLLESRGYSHIRTYYTMMIDLSRYGDAPPPLPAGIELRPFDAEQHTKAVYEAHQDSFADHWGFHTDPYEDWQFWVLNNPTADHTLWKIAWDGETIAGICIPRPMSEALPDMGWIGIVGVRRAYRKMGLGTALLKQAFSTLKTRGFTRGGLAVDSDSLTNAVALYERAGMHVDKQRRVYEKVVEEKEGLGVGD